MNHTAQKPKSMQLAAELDYRREYEAAHELRTMQARIAELEAAAHHADYKMEGWLCKQYPLEACLYPESKDWVEGDYRYRVELLHTMYESVKSEVAQLKAQLHAIGTCGVGQSIQPPVQTDTAAPAQLPAAHQEPVAGARCKIIYNCKSCQHSAGRQSCMLANRAFEGRERPPTPPDWCPLPLYAAPQQPVQQEPVAWIEHEWSGTGLRHLHFEKREPMVRDEVVNPVWTPLCTALPQRQPLTDEQIWADDGIMRANAGLGLLMKDIALLVRAIEQAHGITGGQQ